MFIIIHLISRNRKICRQKTIDKQISQYSLDIAIFPEKPFLLKVSLLYNPLRGLILHKNKSLNPYHLRQVLENLRKCHFHCLCGYSLAPVPGGYTIPYICLTPVVSRSWEDGDEADRSVVDAYGTAPRVGDANIFDESQRVIFGSQRLPSEVPGHLIVACV